MNESIKLPQPDEARCHCGAIGIYRTRAAVFCKRHKLEAEKATRQETAAQIARMAIGRDPHLANANSGRHGRRNAVTRPLRKNSKGGYIA